MNRRMVRAKAARKWHAARQRQVWRFVHGAMDRMSDSLAASIQAHAHMGDMMRNAAREVTGFMAETLARRAVRQVMASLPRGGLVGHSGGVAGMVAPGSLVLPPGQLYMRERGSSVPMRHVGTTGPIAVRVSTRCGTCRELIRQDALYGTRCGCAP